MTFVSDFIMAARADATYRKRQEAWDGARRVEERVNKAKAETAKASDYVEAVLTTMLVIGPGPETIRQYEVRLGYHQEAVILALQESQERLDLSEERLQALRDEAYVTEDGRRVFRSEDGTWVIDETGALVEVDELDPDVIADHRPSAETWLEAVEENRALQEQRQDLVDYQSALDDAQDRLSAGGLSNEDLAELDDLLSNAPTAVRARLPTTDPAASPVQSSAPDASEPTGEFALEGLSPASPGATTTRFQ